VSVPVDCEVVSSWVRDAPQKPARGIVRAQEVDPTGSVLTSVQYTVDLTKLDRAYTVAKISTLPIKGIGRYMFRLHLKQEKSEKWQLVARIHLDVTFEQTIEKHNSDKSDKEDRDAADPQFVSA
jgi:hypothetical protein